MNVIYVFAGVLVAWVTALFLWYAVQPKPNKSFYKQGQKLLILALILCTQSTFAQLFVSPRQVCQDGNDKLIETELRIILKGDSVILARTNERSAYPLNSVRKTRKGVSVRFGQSNKIVLFYHKEQAFTMVLGEAHYFGWL
jgi:hypothetical protein